MTLQYIDTDVMSLTTEYSQLYFLRIMFCRKSLGCFSSLMSKSIMSESLMPESNVSVRTFDSDVGIN